MVIAAALCVVFTVAVLFIVTLLSRGSATAPIEIHPPVPTQTPGPGPSPCPLKVYVTGAVRAPGLVQVVPDARVQDAIDAAGGPAPDADLANYNLAAPVFDGQHLQVPVVGEVEAQSEYQRSQTGVLININTATVEELDELPGVGEVTAEKIVRYRQEHGPFLRIEAIMDVPGIGEAKFDGFKEMITIGP